MNPTLPRAPLALAVVGLLLLPLAGIGSRAGWWHFRTGFQLLRDAAFVGAAAAVLALVLFLVPSVRRGHPGTLLMAFVLGAAVFALPFHWARTAKSLPMIHDITTDTDNPPQFTHTILVERQDAPNTAVYGGPEVAKLQHGAYPDIQPLKSRLPPISVFPEALAVAKEMGWKIAVANSPAGPIEATDTTKWFGFKDDVVVRIAPDGTGSRVDVRSVSRVGKSDVGKNAARIREYLGKLGRKVAK